MSTKGLKINSILTGSCPRCQKESMYATKISLNFSKLLKMNENCGHCGLKYQIEPSFFYGAMYVSYGLNVALMIGIFLVGYFGFHSNFNQIFISMILILIVLTPIIIRLSRNIYINIFVSFDKKYV
jgi:uncharacterized protein (DUF983 family)